MIDRFKTICEKLSDLQKVDRELKRYGAWRHKYELCPPIAEAEVLRLEAKLNIKLPPEYRSYLV